MPPTPTLRCKFDTVCITDTLILIADCDQGMSVTNDAEAVVTRINNDLAEGIGARRLFYRDTQGRYDELTALSGHFAGFRSCAPSQQQFLASLHQARFGAH